MPISTGQSGNPGGKRKAFRLSRAVRKSEGLKTWAVLLAIRDGTVLERKEIGKNADTGAPIFVDVVPSIRDLTKVCNDILNRTWGTPVARARMNSSSGSRL